MEETQTPPEEQQPRRPKPNFKRRWLSLLFTLALIVGLFYRFKIDIYMWSCESEKNSGSCFLAGQFYEENKDLDSALKYYEKSCDAEYGLGCFHMAKVFETQGFKEKALERIKQACGFDYKPACPIN